MIPAHVVGAVMHPSVRVESYCQVATFPVAHMRFALASLYLGRRPGLCLRQFRHGGAPDDPAITTEPRGSFVVQAMNEAQLDAGGRRRPTVDEQTSVDRARHVADDPGAHSERPAAVH